LHLLTSEAASPAYWNVNLVGNLGGQEHSGTAFVSILAYAEHMISRSSILILLVAISAMSLTPASAEENPAQNAFPAIPERGERPAGINDRGYSSAATDENVKPANPGAATQAWLDSVPQDQREKSDAYFEGGYWLILWNFLLMVAISILLLASRLSARLRDFSERATKSKNFQIVFYAIPYLLVVYVLSFPLNLYENFFREHQYDLATQTFVPWFREQLLGLALTLVGGTLLVVVLYAVFQIGRAHV